VLRSIKRWKIRKGRGRNGFSTECRVHAQHPFKFCKQLVARFLNLQRQAAHNKTAAAAQATSPSSGLIFTTCIHEQSGCSRIREFHNCELGATTATPTTATQEETRPVSNKIRKTTHPRRWDPPPPVSLVLSARESRSPIKVFIDGSEKPVPQLAPLVHQ
jgi:hypothetical protein